MAGNCKLATLLQKIKLCMKHREYNLLSLLLLERQITLHSLWCNKLVVRLGLKLGVQNFRIGLSKMDGKNHIGLPKMHGRIHIGLPKVHGRFRIVPPQVFHPIWPHQISTFGEFRCTIAIMQEKHQHVLFEIE